MAEKSSDERQPIMTSQNPNPPTQTKVKSCIDSIPSRYIFTLLGFFGMMNVYAMRVNLSVAMVAMVNSSAFNRSDVSSECPGDNPNVTIGSSLTEGDFAWDETTQGIILGSFFWGYIVTQLPGGRIAETFSGKWLFGCGVLCTAIFTLLTPLAAKSGTGYLIAARILEGLGEGVTFPAMHVMLSRWCLPYERSKLSTFVYTGCQVGTVLAMPITGLLCDTKFGWPTVFYVFGCLGIVWFVFWAIFAYDSPMKHPRISADEKNLYIENAAYGGYVPSTRKEIFPWKQVLSSPAVWAIVVAHFGQNWGFYTLLTEMPTYMKNILHFDVKKNSFFSALPYLGMWIFGLSCSWFADYLRSNGLASTSSVRKVANFVGVVGPAVGLIGITLIGCSEMWNLAFLVLAVTLNGAVYAGFQCNHIDIAPKFAGTLIGISNSVATIPGIAAPYVVGILTENQQTLHQWYIVFYIAAAIYSFVGLFFVLFSSGEEQRWYKYSVDDDSEQFLKDSSIVHSDKDE
ncbi:hypothetical protein CHUAL_001114 [Chamberlinius hualienensis]